MKSSQVEWLRKKIEATPSDGNTLANLVFMRILSLVRMWYSLLLLIQIFHLKNLYPICAQNKLIAMAYMEKERKAVCGMFSACL